MIHTWQQLAYIHGHGAVIPSHVFNPDKQVYHLLKLMLFSIGQAFDGRDEIILGDPGADSGDEEKSKRAEKYMARRKVKNGEKSPWGQCLTRPVPNGRRRSGF